MKVFELAKVLNVKSTLVVDIAKELGQTVSFNSILSDDLEAKLRDNLSEKVVPIITQEDKKGAFVGIVFDGQKFLNVELKLTLDQLAKLNPIFKSEHTTIFGARIELEKKLRFIINEHTVKQFKEDN